MSYQVFLPSTLTQLSQLLAVAPINSAIQFSKNNNGDVSISSSVPASALPSYLNTGVLPQVVTQLTNSANNQSINFYKDNSGNITSSNIENPDNTLPMGYSYQFINGDTVYNTVPIASNLSIPWIYPFSILNAVSTNLWNNTNTLWIDSKETRSINTTIQKIVSKGYNNNV